MIDPQQFGAELADIVKAATAPLLARIEALEGQVKAVEARPAGLTAEALAEQVEAAEGRAKAHADEAMRKALDAIPAPVELPEMPELPDIPALLAEAVEEAVKAIPAPENGKDGASVTLDDVMPTLEKRVDDFLAAIPMPKDGAPGRDGDHGDKGDPGRDGLDVKDLFRADGGRLVAVMSDGTTKDLGVFVGKDGEPGRDGTDGKDGADGLGFEDMGFEADEHGRVLAKFQRGDVVKTIRLPGIVDRGPYKSGESYEKGDAVSYGGSLWIAQEPTGDKPDGSKAWRLAVKAGRPAKSAFDIAKANGFPGTEKEWVSILSAKAIR